MRALNRGHGRGSGTSEKVEEATYTICRGGEEHEAKTAPTITNPNVEVMAATKRRRVELVHGVGQDSNSRESSPEKGKAPKKKPRTITDIATERYLPRNQISDALDVTSNFFESRTTTKKIPLNDVTAPNANELPKKPTRKRSTSKSGSDVSGPKEKSKKASSKSNAKPKLMAEKLLSPGSALVRMNKQDILFGTSSQLALEESPTMVRQIQLAIKESEADAEVSPHEFLAPPPRWPRLCKTEGKRGLWNAGSRDDEGGLLDIAEDVYIPEFDRTQDFPLLMDGVNEDPVGDAPVVRGAKDGKSPSAILISSDPPTPQHVISQMPQAFPERKSHSQPDTVADSIFLDIDDLLSQPPPSNQNVKYQCPTNHDPPPSTQNFQLASPYSKASFLDSANTSPRKRRGRPPLPSPTLSADRAQAPTIIPAHSPPQLKKSVSAPFMTPSRGSGRFIDIEEILDSEDEALAILSPTPPRSRNLQDSEPLPLVSLSPSRPAGKTSKSGAMSDVAAVQIHKIPTTHLLWNDIKPIVCASITTHIRSLPPTNDPAHPSWHEKILMYDPIVLEDFTAYLNTKTGIRTFKKATQKQIKAWNKKTKLEGSHEIGVLEWEDKVLAVEKELECNQVRDWCESMSVCCIWGEGRGKGGARRGLY